MTACGFFDIAVRWNNMPPIIEVDTEHEGLSGNEHPFGFGPSYSAR